MVVKKEPGEHFHDLQSVSPPPLSAAHVPSLIPYRNPVVLIRV